MATTITSDGVEDVCCDGLHTRGEEEKRRRRRGRGRGEGEGAGEEEATTTKNMTHASGLCFLAH